VDGIGMWGRGFSLWGCGGCALSAVLTTGMNSLFEMLFLREKGGVSNGVLWTLVHGGEYDDENHVLMGSTTKRLLPNSVFSTVARRITSVWGSSSIQYDLKMRSSVDE